MFQQILVPTDGAPGLERVSSLALELAVASGGSVHTIAVTDTRLEPEGMAEADRDAWRAAARAEGQAAVEAVADRAREVGVEPATAIREGAPYQEMLAYIEEAGIDLVVMGMYSGEETYPPQLGSTTERLMAFGDVPVLASQPGERTELAGPTEREWTVLIATDGSEVARAATEQGLAFADAYDAAVDVVHVLEADFFGDVANTEFVTNAARETGTEAVDGVVSMADKKGLSVSTAVTEGDPAEKILEHADTVDADIVVMGKRGIMSPFEDMLGGTVGRVIRRSNRPVLVTE